MLTELRGMLVIGCWSPASRAGDQHTITKMQHMLVLLVTSSAGLCWFLAWDASGQFHLELHQQDYTCRPA